MQEAFVTDPRMTMTKLETLARELERLKKRVPKYIDIQRLRRKMHWLPKRRAR